MTPQEEAVTVIQADRDAAGGEMYRQGRISKHEHLRIVAGKRDDWPEVQAFARHRTSSSDAAPEGWVLVPREPTEEWLNAFGEGPLSSADFTRDEGRRLIAAMLSAAPTGEAS